MRKFLVVYVTQGPFMGTGHLCVNARDEDLARDLFVKAFPVCAITAILEMK